MPSRLLMLILIPAGLFVACGSGCPRLVGYRTPVPQHLPETPTLVDVMAAVNENTGKITSLSADQVAISAPLTPTLNASLAYERPRRFRLVADTMITGPEVDLGSNDELFWVWIKRSDPQVMYYCRHAEFAASPARSLVPVEPEWLIEAVGAARLDPGLAHQGPFVRKNHRLEIHTALPTPTGQQTKVTIVDSRSGWVLEQHLYDANRQLVASAVASRHWTDPLTGVVLPKQIEFRSQAAGFSLKMSIQQWRVNEAGDALASRWQMPSYNGWPPIDLARITPGQLAASTAPAVLPHVPQAATTPVPPVGQTYGQLPPQVRGGPVVGVPPQQHAPAGQNPAPAPPPAGLRSPFRLR